ncbi:MAG: chromosome segregation protein [Chloroflexi bacterium ADurb.Bin360]|nr:MAG: chromosome segregation protein [Chloroflexi bacterium ADurb.Bin360]
MLNEQMTRGIKQGNYEQYLRERIHRNANGVLPLMWASIGLEFEHAFGGERHTYVLERSWKDDGKRVKEVLNISQDSKPMEGLDSRQYEDFVQDLIPPALMQLLFFDSEKIQTLANTSLDVQRITLSRVIKSLLGLNLVDRLQTDLSVYRRRQQRDNHIDVAQKQIATLENALSQIDNEEKQLISRLATLDSQIDTVTAEIEIQESEVARAGGGFARDREMHKSSQLRLRAEMESVQQGIRDLCAGLLPFAITPMYTTAVKNQLLRESEYQYWLASKSLIDKRLEKIQSEVMSPGFWEGTGAEVLFSLQQSVGERVIQTLQRMVEPPEEMREVDLRHQVSESERGQLLGWIEESQNAVPAQIENLTTRLAQLKHELEEAEFALRLVPADDVLGPLVEALNSQHQNLGQLIQLRSQTQDDLRRLKSQADGLKRELHKAREDKATRQILADKIRRVLDVQVVLDDFSEELVGSRVSQLRDALMRNFNQLCRKEHLLSQVDIDPHDFSVTLIGLDGQLISQTTLSAGEKQIYALALLWALRQVSGHPLPMIIDAPLARLDSDHRRNLVEHYFPHASHQVILSSTDTEVDEDFYAALGDHVSRSYYLDYNQTQRSTQVREGYFEYFTGRGRG